MFQYGMAIYLAVMCGFLALFGGSIAVVIDKETTTGLAFGLYLAWLIVPLVVGLNPFAFGITWSAGYVRGQVGGEEGLDVEDGVHRGNEWSGIYWRGVFATAVVLALPFFARFVQLSIPALHDVSATPLVGILVSMFLIGAATIAQGHPTAVLRLATRFGYVGVAIFVIAFAWLALRDAAVPEAPYLDEIKATSAGNFDKAMRETSQGFNKKLKESGKTTEEFCRGSSLSEAEQRICKALTPVSSGASAAIGAAKEAYGTARSAVSGAMPGISSGSSSATTGSAATSGQSGATTTIDVGAPHPLDPTVRAWIPISLSVIGAGEKKIYRVRVQVEGCLKTSFPPLGDYPAYTATFHVANGRNEGIPEYSGVPWVDKVAATGLGTDVPFSRLGIRYGGKLHFNGDVIDVSGEAGAASLEAGFATWWKDWATGRITACDGNNPRVTFVAVN